MKRVDLDGLQVIEQSQHAAASFGFNCFAGLGFWCGNLCIGFACW